MSAIGGSSDKLGNAYETLWTIDQLLQLVSGEALALRLEPLDRWESQGIEFQVKRPDGTLEHWSSKRQRADAPGWTLDKLTKPEANGRSILGDLLHHIERSPENRGVFVSALAAPRLTELCSYAHDETLLAARLRQSAVLEGDFKQYILDKLCNNDEKRALRFLQRVRVHTIDESQLRDRVHFAIRTLFYAVDALATDPVGICGYLTAFLLRYIHQWLDQSRLLNELERHYIRRRDWALEPLVSERIANLCEDYCALVHTGLINGSYLHTVALDSIVPQANTTNRKTLLVAEAGSGKSCALGIAARTLRDSGIPVMPIRFDRLSEEILSTTELGRKLGLPESPVIVLAGVAGGRPCALIIDQLDAISMASGRRTELWSLFDALRREAERFPQMSMLVACRGFDLEHDDRIRGLLDKNAGFAKVELKPLSPEQIDGALEKAGHQPTQVLPTVKALLTLPLHLWMYLKLPPRARTTIYSREQLFELFWKQKERNVRQRAAREIAWARIIETLSEWLSNNQQLSAPPEVLDAYLGDAELLISETFCTKSEGRFRFFHESFFDYEFARTLVRRQKNLLTWLGQDEQHLFRRAQVRQVLAYLRMTSTARYLAELEALLSADERIRFHLKRFIMQWLTSLTDPTEDELAVLWKVAKTRPEIRSDIAWIGAGNVAWFDVYDRQGIYKAALNSGDEKREYEAIRLLSINSILESRGHRVAQILRQTRKPTEVWRRHLHNIVKFGRVRYNRAILDLFLDMIDEGLMDGAADAPVDWSGFLHFLPEKKPEYACEVIAHWFDRVTDLWRRSRVTAARGRLFEPQRFDTSDIIDSAKGAPEQFVQLMLPRVAALVAELAAPEEEGLDCDPIWSSRGFGDEPRDVSGAILAGLARAMEHVAYHSPIVFREQIAQYLDRPHDTIAYLVLRALTAGNELYANEIADYLVADPRRLRVGYRVYSSSGGSGAHYISCRTIQVASPQCTEARHAALEVAILGVKVWLESKHPQRRGITQLELLSCMDSKRFSPATRAAWGMLKAKFPTYKRAEPERLRFVGIGSPVKEKAHLKMTDKQWLGAMRKYAGVDYRAKRDLSGGERELAGAIEREAQSSPLRFIAVAERMPDTFPASYFDAIVRGVADCQSADQIHIEDVCRLVRRVHRLPGRPCGRWLSWLLKTWKETDWPDEVLHALCWYALHDADPKGELWRKTEGRPVYYGGDPYTAGINSTRGAAAGAIAHFLFDHPGRFETLRLAIESLVQDSSVAVRSCAIEILYSMIREKASTAIQWLNDIVKTGPEILATPPVEQFIHYAGHQDYLGLRQTIFIMLNANDVEVVKRAAGQIIALALTREVPIEDVERVRSGTDAMREVAAEVYATNVTDEVVGSLCRELVVPFFSDPAKNVRKAAARALGHLSALDTIDQAGLLSAFLQAEPGVDELEPVMWQLEESPVRLPDLACQLAEICLRQDGGLQVASLPKIVVRLYAQTMDTQIQKRCLDMIDRMEKENSSDTYEVLRIHDR